MFHQMYEVPYSEVILDMLPLDLVMTSYCSSCAVRRAYFQLTLYMSKLTLIADPQLFKLNFPTKNCF